VSSVDLFRSQRASNPSWYLTSRKWLFQAHELHSPIAKGPLAVGIATFLDIFALTLGQHRIAANIGVRRVFGVTPSSIESIFKAFRIRGAIAVFSPVGDMGLPLCRSGVRRRAFIRVRRDLLVLLTGSHFLCVGVYLRHFVDRSKEAEGQRGEGYNLGFI
jgi:hypothetical protein